MKSVVLWFLVIAVAVGAVLVSRMAFNASLNTEELARAHGMNWWRIELPGDLPDDAMIGLGYKAHGGEETLFGMAGGVADPQGMTVLVVVWPLPEGDKLQYSIQWDQTSVRGTLPNRFARSQLVTMPTGFTSELGVLLLKGSEEGGITGGQELAPGEFGLSLMLAK